MHCLRGRDILELDGCGSCVLLGVDVRFECDDGREVATVEN